MTITLPIHGTIPQRANPTDAGLDLALSDAAGAVTIEPGYWKTLPTGTSVAIPAGYVGKVCSRSGLAAKHGIAVLNAPGIVDADYRGEIKVVLFNFGIEPHEFTPGDRIAQLLIEKIELPALVEVQNIDDLGTTIRGDGGFGSSGVSEALRS